MCGIFGVVYDIRSIVPERDKLDQSAQALRHRGPDSQAAHTGPGVGFAHTRLSFLDISSRADQPFWDETGRYVLIYNGEIYNHEALRAVLVSEGRKLATTSDTEVLLYWVLRKDPAEAIAELEGMFAFALYDTETHTTILARDRFGMKPLFIAENEGRLLFASETKAMRPWMAPSVDRFSIASYLLKFRGPTREFIFEDGVRSLSPGQMLIKRAGAPGERKTFATLEGFLDPALMADLEGATPTEAVDRLNAMMDRSVELHLLADVPVGAFCSGGVDSSLLMALAARKHSNLAIFHANVKGRFSEYDAALALSKHLKLDLLSVDVEEQDFVDYLPEAIRHFEQPFADRPNCVPMMRVAQLARGNKVKGLLSGEGSDECFLGYPWLGRRDIDDAWRGFGGRLRSLVRSVPEFGPLLWPKADNNGDAVRTLLNRREITDDELRTKEALRAHGLGPKHRHQQWTLDYLHHHLRVLLHRNDTMGMAGSIESRFPFLDHSVAQFAVNLPGRYKLRFDWTAADKAHPFVRDKWVVRQVADRYVPKELSRRKKFGFWTTVFERIEVKPRYFSGGFAANLLGLTDAQIEATGNEAGRAFMLRLLHIDLWGRICLYGEGDAENVSRLRDYVTILPR